MDLVPDDKKRGLETPVWAKYKEIVNAAEGKQVKTIDSAYTTCPSARICNAMLYTLLI